jgi:hypothetical protein
MLGFAARGWNLFHPLAALISFTIVEGRAPELLNPGRPDTLF